MGRAQHGVPGPRLTHCLLPPSSSDAESDCGSSEASSAKPREERAWQPESPPLPKPLTRHVSLREPLTRADSPPCLEELQAAHGEQRVRRVSFWNPRREQGPSWAAFPPGGR